MNSAYSAAYKGWLTGPDGKITSKGTFLGESSCTAQHALGLSSGQGVVWM